MTHLLFRKSSGEILSVSADPIAPFSATDQLDIADVDGASIQAGMLFDPAAKTVRLATADDHQAFAAARIADHQAQALKDAQARFDSGDAVCRFGVGCLRAIWEQMDVIWSAAAASGFDTQHRQDWVAFRARAQQAAGDSSLI
jgi:hypothetical protein